MRKVPPHPEYPPEEGRYLRGNDYSPAAVIIILTYDAEAIPPEIEKLVRAGVEAGAALSGTLQTANIGIEKVTTLAPINHLAAHNPFRDNICREQIPVF